MRAVEQRRFLLRVSTSGPSAIVDPWGRVEARSVAFREAALVAEVSPRSDRTVYGRVGDAFAFGCGGVVLAALCLARLRSARGPAGRDERLTRGAVP